jgi:hypothetical protein
MIQSKGENKRKFKKKPQAVPVLNPFKKFLFLP